ncbi:MAG TPA: hypothetical protein VGS79_23990 [Puia sp.]|nr:hypothetical protein [Puia sp.]
MHRIKLAPVLLFALILPTLSVFAQKEESKYVEFSYIQNKKNRPVTSLYNKIDFLDSRQDSTAIGIIDTGSRRIVRAVLKSPVQPQLADLLQGHSASNSGDGELLFQLRRFSFAEASGTRYCYLTVTLYGRRGDEYGVVAGLDTSFSLSEPSVLYKDLVDAGNVVMNQFFGRSIGIAPNGAVSYALADLAHIDSFEKRQIPLYNTTTYTEGLYSTYAAFKAQAPDVSGSVVTKADGSIDKLKFNDRKWKEEKYAHIYAVVYKGMPYVVTHSGYYPLQKQGDDLYFTGKLRIHATEGEKALGQIAFGMVGQAMVAGAGDNNVYRVLIDHQNGEFIHLRVLEEVRAE